MKLMPVPNICGRFLQFLDGTAYPCVGSKSVSARGSIETHEFNELGERENDQPLLDGLSRFVAMVEGSACDPDIVHSYVAIFHGPFDMDERHFESLMWAQLWRLRKRDLRAGNRPVDDVSSYTNSPLSGLSISGHPFFLIGLHPHATRPARRFSHPVMVFNSHRQFEKLRQDGRFEKMQAAMRSRDIESQGSVNPKVAGSLARAGTANRNAHDDERP